MSVQPLTRRSLLTGGAIAVAGGIAGFIVGRNSDAASAKSPTSYANAYGPATGGGSGGAQVLTSLSDVTGDGVVVHGVVLTRTATGGVQGVSATCTHQGCTVGSPQGGVVTCPCHGSQFEASTGRVIRGPATAPLPAVPVAPKMTTMCFRLEWSLVTGLLPPM